MAAKLSGGGGGKYEVKQNAAINVTPFVDVMLVLLIIFMVAAPLASVSIKVNLPPAQAKAAKSPPKIVYLSIKKDGRVFVDDNESSLDSLGDDLKAEVGGRDPQSMRIFIRGDKDMEYQDFMGVIDKLQDNGFYSVALVGEDRSGLGK
ncbi:MAG: biopolymer transporter ExbD [Alphaproteobacteria bacterium]|jgi:biopolymer transport protein ExbD/biopolymer transport protein TolR|nr:biopolymer transporter ExbD [Alphaproteobacteria bacterium]